MEKQILSARRQSKKAISTEDQECDALHLSNAIEEELDERIEEEASQQVGVCVGLPVDVGPQEQGSRNNSHESHLQPISFSRRSLTQQLMTANFGWCQCRYEVSFLVRGKYSGRMYIVNQC